MPSLMRTIPSLLSSVPLRLTLCCLLLAALGQGPLLPGRALANEEQETVIHREDSLYQFLIILENKEKNERYMANLEKTTTYQGGIKLDAPDRLLFEYTRISFLGLAHLPQLPNSALFVGLGIGSMPRFMAKHFPDMAIEVAEIDPAVLKLAKQYFFFPEEGGGMTVKVEDGRQFIKRRAKQGYDIIFLDAYQGDTIPFHLTTQEFLREVKAKLNSGGVVVANILSPKKNKFFTAMIKTYGTEFADLTVYQGKESGNFVFIASDRPVSPVTVHGKAREIQEVGGLGFDLAAIAHEQRIPTPKVADAEILTDDFAPVNLYRHMEEKGP